MLLDYTPLIKRKERIDIMGFIRQRRTYCGDFLEVDIFPYTENQEQCSKRGKRSKKKTVTEPKQRNLNDKNAKRYFIQLVNTNFGENDYILHLTYKDKFMPENEEEAERMITNYFRRIRDRRKKEGLEPLKYILVTEYVEGSGKDKKVRMHHHVFMNGGLDRDTIEDLWCVRKKKGQKKGEMLGYANVRSLQTDKDENGAEALCRYLTKYKRKKRWSPSQNLKKPYCRTNDHKYRRREVERIVKDLPDVSYWEKKYPGWTLQRSDYAVKVVYNYITGWSIYLKMRRLE